MISPLSSSQPDHAPDWQHRVEAFARNKAIIPALLAISATLRCVVALRPLEAIDSLTIPDDAYLSMTIARNIARGLGPLYGTEFTNGFQPLYVFLMTPVFAIVPNDLFTPIRIALFLLITFDTLTLYLLVRFTRDTSRSPFTPIIIALAWSFSPYVISTTLNGLETAISAFFVVAVLYSFRGATTGSDKTFRPLRYIALGGLIGLAILARIDNALLALSIGIVFLWKNRREQAWIILRSLGIVTIAALVVVLPWLAYSIAYTGDVYPVSGKAVRFNSLSDVQHAPTVMNLYLPMLRKGIAVLVKNNWVFIATIAALGFSLRPDKHLRRSVLQVVGLPTLFAVSLFTSYTCYTLTPWFFERYLYPISLLILLTMGVLVNTFLDRHSKRAIEWGTTFAILMVVLNVLQPSFRRLFTSPYPAKWGYMNLGLWAKDEFKQNTIVGAQQSGGLGYFAQNITVMNLDGVVSKSCYESLVERRNFDYIRSAGVEYMISWKVDSMYVANHSTNYTPESLRLQKRIEGFQSFGQYWYLYRVDQGKDKNALGG